MKDPNIKNMKDPKEFAACYQPLFEHIANEYGATLTYSEMDEIIALSEKVRDDLNNFNKELSEKCLNGWTSPEYCIQIDGQICQKCKDWQR